MLRIGEEVPHALLLLRADQRPAVEVELARAHLQLGKRVREPREQRLVSRALDQHAAARRARLPGVLHDRRDEHGQRGVEIGVGEDDLRRLPAEFERHGDVVVGGHLDDRRAGCGRAGERNVVDARMPRERRARLVAVARDDVQRAVGQARFRREFGDAQDRHARVLGRLHHARVAGRERRRDAAPENLHRVVPRHDVAGHAMRLADRQHRVAGLVGQGLAVQLVGGARVELEVARDAGRVGVRLLERLAGVARFELRDLVVARADQHRQAREDASAVGGARVAPRAVVGGARGLHGAVDVGGVAARELREHLAVGGIDHGDGFADGRRDPSVADEMLRFFHALSLLVPLALRHASRATTQPDYRAIGRV